MPILTRHNPKIQISQVCAPSIWILATTPVPRRSPKEPILWAKWPGPRDLGNSSRSWTTWNNGKHFLFFLLPRTPPSPFVYDACWYSFSTGRHFPVDIYGTGPHFSDIRDTAVRRGIPVRHFLLLLHTGESSLQCLTLFFFTTGAVLWRGGPRVAEGVQGVCEPITEWSTVYHDCRGTYALLKLLLCVMFSSFCH